jgi:hypothetical protein
VRRPADDHEDPVDLSALGPELERRADRVLDRLSGRIVSTRAAGSAEPTLARAVQRRLARAALPAALAAAAACAALVFTSRSRRPDEAAFVGLLLGGDEPLPGWLTENRRPAVPELLEMLEGAP